MATTQKRWCFDLDGTLCADVGGCNYHDAEPIEKAIQFVRDRKAEGDYIIIDSARGTMTGVDWRWLAVRQLSEWGCPCDELHVGTKPFADVYVDDKAAGLEVFGDTYIHHIHGDDPEVSMHDDPAKAAGPQTIKDVVLHRVLKKLAEFNDREESILLNGDPDAPKPEGVIYAVYVSSDRAGDQKSFAPSSGSDGTSQLTGTGCDPPILPHFIQDAIREQVANGKSNMTTECEPGCECKAGGGPRAITRPPLTADEFKDGVDRIVEAIAASARQVINVRNVN